MLAMGFGFWEDWELRDKVTFNMFTRVISVNEGVTSIDVKTDVYSAMLRWYLADNNTKIGQVVRVIGGDPTVNGQKAGDLYFLVKGWRLQIDVTKTAMSGSLFSDNFPSPLIDFSGKAVTQILVASLVTGVDSSPATAEDIWNHSVRTITQQTGLTEEQATKLAELIDRLDLNVAKPNTYADDGSSIGNGDWTLTKTPNGDGTSTVQRA